MDNLRQRVFDHLNRALDDGQFEPPDGYLHGTDADGIALDLVVFAGDFEGIKDRDVLPFVTEWLDENEILGTP